MLTVQWSKKVFLAEVLNLSRDLARIGQQQRELETRIWMHDEQRDKWLQRFVDTPTSLRRSSSVWHVQEYDAST